MKERVVGPEFILRRFFHFEPIRSEPVDSETVEAEPVKVRRIFGRVSRPGRTQRKHSRQGCSRFENILYFTKIVKFNFNYLKLT